MTATLIPVLAPAVAAAPSSKCADSAPSTKAATALAAACKREVAIDSSRSEYVQIVARPDGKLVFESAIAPQRTKRSDGTWANIDLGLKRGQDSLLRPVASVADVAFSAGGKGPLVTVKRNGKTMTMSWPAALPAPTVSGDSATYANVLKDVDLVVRATRTGFTHVLVVKTPAAAASVSEIRFKMGGDAAVKRTADGALRAVAGDVLVASARPAVMWDSTTTPGADTLSSGGARTATGASVVDTAPSSARAAGDIARIKPVGTEVTAAGELVLRPDTSLLSAASAYPIFVDPDWEYGSKTGQKWAYATDNNESNSDRDVARVGKQVASSGIYRSFFEFPTAGNTANGTVSLKGKYIHTAYVGMTLTHSSSCDDAYTYMYATPAINAVPKASWPTMSLGTLLASQKGHANEAGGCGEIQPDMAMNFSGSTVLNHVRTAANNSWNSITVGFSARDGSGSGEGTTARWMKYIPEDAKLVVEYDSIPGAPKDLQVGGVTCPTSGSMTLGTMTPSLSAVYPDADVTQTLSGAYEWIEVPTGGISTVTDTSPTRKTPPSPTTATANGRSTTTTALSGLAEGKLFAFRVRTTDPAPYSKTSAWSSWCQFKVDVTSPVFSASMTQGTVSPGTRVNIQFSSDDVSVRQFKYGWGTATNAVAAQGVCDAIDHTRCWRMANIYITVPKFGQNTLATAAIDSAANERAGSITFMASRPTPAVAYWGLESRPGVDEVQALADQQPGLAGNTPVAATSVSWTKDVRLSAAGTATFNGTSSYASEPSGVMDTSKTFSIAMWVRLTDSGSDRTVVAKDSSGNATFVLQYQKSSNKWLAQMPSATSGTPTLWQALSSSTPQLNVWTHLAGVYDTTERTLTLYINGVSEGVATGVTGVNEAGRPLWIGRASANWWKGSVAEVKVFDRVLVGHDFTGQLATDEGSGGFTEPGLLDPTEVARWTFDDAAPCLLKADFEGACEAPDFTDWKRSLRLSYGTSTETGYSNTGLGASFDGTHTPESGQPVSTFEFGKSAIKIGTTTDGDGDAINTWQDAPVVRTDESYTISVWAYLSTEVSPTATYSVVSHSPGTSGKVPFAILFLGDGKWAFTVSEADSATASWQPIRSSSPAAIGKWTQLTAVYDAIKKESRFYVNGVIQGNPRPGVLAWHKNGPISVGAYTTGTYPWNGGIDEVRIFRGAMSSAAVEAAHAQQSSS